MSLEKAMADMLRTQWRRADEFTGRKVGSLQELQEKLPKERYNGDCYENEDSPIEDVTVYSANRRILHQQEYVAYECNNSCKGIIIGPPAIKSYDTIEGLSGKKGVRYSCTNCDGRLYDKDIGWS
ncbi:MAG: hypothetical protein Q8R47_05180 [Nanoarchaeota archaeon]|nr:hypothetical protein [Nanoarchaeota archaeon]